mmetsp:Transcript_33727/g.54372  ORF Transcript_33727/g.54372 Transcript_33727/m.54372 type:complete len:96 (-) Transcript_33727:490-777(-)
MIQAQMNAFGNASAAAAANTGRYKNKLRLVYPETIQAQIGAVGHASAIAAANTCRSKYKLKLVYPRSQANSLKLNNQRSFLYVVRNVILSLLSAY